MDEYGTAFGVAVPMGDPRRWGCGDRAPIVAGAKRELKKNPVLGTAELPLALIANMNAW